MSESRYAVGIDLGTTNCALAYSPLPDGAPVRTAPVAQLVNPGEVRDEPLLPSSLYLPGAADFPEGSLALPWDDAPETVVGMLARKRGVESATRLVASAKSWLSHAGVDRTSPILPWQAPQGVPMVSPVDASARYLEHLRRAWNHQFPEDPLEAQEVLVTVPASFDAVARELTLDAAGRAGLPRVTLLEEPQAAFYAWIERHEAWRDQVRAGDLILVADIGGGTTDFTLIAVIDRDGVLELDREAVGEHILLGGDNMDLALARTIETELAAKGRKLDGQQLYALWHQCRAAKERLLTPGAPLDEEPVTILGRGSGLVGGTIKAALRRADCDRVLLDGFFPRVGSTDMPQRQRRVGLQEIGLPYAADAAITRHLARFLRQPPSRAEHVARRGPDGLAAPTHVLFNGGVLHAGPLRERLMEVLNSWLAEAGFPPARVLEGEDLMHAVARGAAYYGRARQGRGVRIRAGLSRSYYVGIESAMPAVPGMPSPLKALTVAQFGTEEGSHVPVPGREFGLIVGEPAEFRFFSSAARKDDAPGELLEEIGPDVEEMSPMEVVLDASQGAGQMTPVSFETVVTETGMLQLWCVARDGRRWKLEFNVRERVEQT
ncbi:MAG: Hsp70 family protein [Bryobacterales bacterium]|nr:Hsp70 family protein [Bryobacterales bacterium]